MFDLIKCSIRIFVLSLSWLVFICNPHNLPDLLVLLVDAFFLIALLLQELSMFLSFFLLDQFLCHFPSFVLAFPKASHECYACIPIKLYAFATPLFFILGPSA